MKAFIVLSAILAIAAAAPTNEEPTSIRKMVANCLESDETFTCLSIKGITALNRAARSASIDLFPGVSFQRDQSVSVRGAKAISENEIADSLPNESTERSGRLYDLAIDALASFVGSHSLELKFPKESSQELARAIEEGRGKLKKFIAPLILAFGAKIVALIPLFLGGLIFLAIKALIVSKIAFVLAALTGLQKLGAGAGGLNLLGKFTNGAAQPSAGWSSATPSAGWSSGTGAAAQYPYARNYDTAQDLAYNAYATDNSAQQQPQQ